MLRILTPHGERIRHLNEDLNRVLNTLMNYALNARNVHVRLNRYIAIQISFSLRSRLNGRFIASHALFWGANCTADARVIGRCSFGATPASISTQFLFSKPYDAPDRYFRHWARRHERPARHACLVLQVKVGIASFAIIACRY
ncbi:hypothetical protein [Paraburkholderia tropica]|uniref:hypothetical protein n=1 Tax=Paraburkholderia tropica TaxID=92647 RepID=UPI0031D47BE1